MLAKLNAELTVLDLGTRASDYSRRMFDGPRDEVEIAARQVLLAAIAGERLNAAILEAWGRGDNGEVRAPIPALWVEHLLRSGVRVSRLRSAFRFGALIGRRFRGGLGQILAILRQPRDPQSAGGGIAIAHFVDIAEPSLPRPSGSPSYDVVSWYIQWDGRVSDLAEIRHPVMRRGPEVVKGVVLRPARSAIPPLTGVARIRFVAWSAYAVTAASLAAATGRWVNALLLGEAAKAQQMKLAAPDQLAREYLFSLSNAIYRPLWTYVAERRGSIVSMFNYAASFHRFKTERGYPHLEVGAESNTWQRVLLWSEPLVEFSRQALKRASRVELVPPIWFSDSDEELPVASRPCVAVFDVTPVRPACLPPFAPEIDYRNYAVGRKFLEDIYAVLSSLGYDMMWKRKRAFGSAHDLRYIRFAEEMASRPGVLSVPPGISAFRVVEQCKAVISMPFTSTALIGVATRPSVFFDPTGVLFEDDRAAQGIPLLSTRAQLVEWLSQ